MRYFDLFALPVAFDIDPAVLAERYRELQRVVHPDKFAHASEQEKLLAVRQTADINDAFNTLKQPLARAEYMLSERGVDLRHEQQTLQDPRFLMQQMEWREAMAELAELADPVAAIDELSDEFSQLEQQLFSTLIPRLTSSDAAELQVAADAVRKLKFVFKLHSELERIEDSLLDD